VYLLLGGGLWLTFFHRIRLLTRGYRAISPFWQYGLLCHRYFVPEATRQATMTGSDHRRALPFLSFGVVGVAGVPGNGDHHSALTAAICDLGFVANALFAAQCTNKGGGILYSAAVVLTKNFGGSAHALVWILPCVSRATQHGASGDCAIPDWRRTVDRLVLHSLRLHRPFRGKGNGKAPCAATSQRPGLLFLQFGINRSIQCWERCAIAAQEAHCCDSDVDSGSAGRRAPPVLMRFTKPSNHARIEGSGAPEGPGRELV